MKRRVHIKSERTIHLVFVKMHQVGWLRHKRQKVVSTFLIQFTYFLPEKSSIETFSFPIANVNSSLTDDFIKPVH